MKRLLGFISGDKNTDGKGHPHFLMGGISPARMYEFKGGSNEDAINRVFELIYPYGRKEENLFREMCSLIESHLPGEREESASEKYSFVMMRLDIPDAADPLHVKRFENDPDWELRKNGSEETKTDSDTTGE
ncbi:MAG: hypothetical protein J6S27_02610 [Thermoguttaceae bacterium]|nr:hypothetical protein [Thermoguttaceae bacterium]